MNATLFIIHGQFNMEMKFYHILLCLFTASSLVSCGDDAESNPSELGGLEGTSWELSFLETTPGNSTMVEDNYWSTQFIEYADHIGLPYEKLGIKSYIAKDTVSSESNKTYTLSFTKNTCTWNIDEVIKHNGNEVTFNYDCFKFDTQDFIVPNQRYNTVMDTIRITSIDVTYCYNKQFEEGQRFLLNLNNGVYEKLIDTSAKEIQFDDEYKSDKRTFNNLKVEPSSFIMQNGDEIYSAQYDVTAGWLILNMISPKNEEIGKFSIKKIK